MVGLPGPMELMLSLWMFWGLGSAGLPVGLPPAEPDELLARVAPEECLFYATWAAMAEPDGASANQTEQLLAEPEVQYLVTEGLKRIEAAVKEAAPRGGPPPELIQDAFGWGKTLLSHSAAFFLQSAEMTPDGPNIRAAAIVNVGADAPQLKQKLAGYQAAFAGGVAQPVQIGGDTWYRIPLGSPGPAITWGTKGKYLIVAVGEGTIEGIIQRAYTGPPQWLVDLRRRFAVDRESTLSYVNVKALVEALAPLAGMAGPQAVRAIDAVGLRGVTSLASVTGLDQEGFVSRALLGIEGEPAGIFTLAAAEPLTAESLRAIPHDATFAMAVRLDAAKLLQTIRSVAAQIEPRAGEQMDQALAMFAQQTGVDVQNDLLEPLGDVWCLYNSPGEGGLLITGLTAVVTLDDPQRVAEAHGKWVAMAQAITEQGFARGRGPRINKSAFAGRDVYVLDVGEPGFPFAPSWCLTDKHLVLALFPQNIKAFLARGGQFQSLADVPAVANLLGGEQPPWMLSYADTRAVFELVYPLLQFGLQVAVTEMQREGIDIDLSLLPSAGAIGKHLRPRVAVVRRTEDGIEAVGHQTLPGSNIGVNTPIAVALILPAIQAAREAARRSQCANNLKQIGLAIHYHHDVFKRFPRAAGPRTEGEADVSWRVAILPFIEQQALYDQYDFKQPWDSEHNLTVAENVIPQYLCPSSPRRFKTIKGHRIPCANYVMITGKEAIGDPERALSFTHIKDGTSNTIMVVEVKGDDCPAWTEPVDLAFDDAIRGVNVGDVRSAGSFHPGGLNVLLCDGSVNFIPETIDLGVLKALFTRSGGEAVDSSSIYGPSSRRRRFAPVGPTAVPVPVHEEGVEEPAVEGPAARALAPVFGRVTLDGQPLAGVTVTFQPLGRRGPAATAKTEADGSFRLATPGMGPGVRPGQYTVSFGKPAGAGPAGRLPLRYTDPATSGLTAEVESGRNEFSFDLRSD